MADGTGSKVPLFNDPNGVAGMIVEGGPNTTLRNCANITKFVANAVSNQRHGGIDFDTGDCEAIFRILYTVSSAMEYVADHVSDRVEAR